MRPAQFCWGGSKRMATVLSSGEAWVRGVPASVCRSKSRDGAHNAEVASGSRAAWQKRSEGRRVGLDRSEPRGVK